jgi:hypothetical protein
MPRMTLVLWLCGSGHRNGPEAKTCSVCGAPRVERHAAVHASERAVIYRNPATGERRTPPRADQPMPVAYAAQGFVREEIMSMTQYERENNVVHEASNFAPGSEPAPWREPQAPKLDPVRREALINDLRDAAASGPWTSNDSAEPSVFTVPV